MAPQQNSTLIDENLEICPSLLNIPEVINRYSPILPPKIKENIVENNINSNFNNYCHYLYGDDNPIPKWEHTEKEQRQYPKKKHFRNGSDRSGHSRRSRSISLCGINSTVEQGHKEITIWLNNDNPRYVSGVSNKTTCNDIIKAIIDDEISNCNYEYCRLLKDGTASRDYSDFVITECWRGIERSYDGNMAILPVWTAWSRVHNEIRLCLKHHKDIQDPAKVLKTNTTLSSIRNYICKLLNFAKSGKHTIKQNKIHKIMKIKEKENKYQAHEIQPEDTLRQKKRIESKEKRPSTKASHEEIEAQARTEINKEKLKRLMESRSSVRKHTSARRKNQKLSPDGRRSRSNPTETKKFLRKRKNPCIRSSIRTKLAQKNAEMNDLYDREYALTRELTNKCKMYKLHNDLYTTCDRNLEVSVGQIQRSIEACAEEIIQTEHELLEVKNEIKNDISVINNLKRLTLDTACTEPNVPICMKNGSKPQPDAEPFPSTIAVVTTGYEQMQFVDNIYEFCDNNASMLV